jgi:predicted MFS family arabinose efflux permease
MVDVGGIFVVILSAYFGRLLVSFWFTVLAYATAIWCTAATSFESFIAARILNGLFSSVSEAVGPTSCFLYIS